ncbi:MAG: YncE family protein [Gemmatimonadota bacterium]
MPIMDHHARADATQRSTLRRAPRTAQRTAPLTVRTLALVTSIGVALVGSPAGAQVAGVTGTIVVTNKTPFTATIIDVASGKALATLPTGRGPHEVALSSDGRTAVVTDYGSGASPSLTVIDLPGLRVARTIPLDSYRAPHGIVYLPGDSLVAVTSEASNNLVIVHVASGAIRKAIGTGSPGSHMVGATANGAVGYTGNMRANSVSQLDLAKGTLLKGFPVPETPEAINVTPDGKEVWVGSNATGRVSVLDPATGTVTTAAEGVTWPYRVLFSPDVATVMIPDMTKNELRFLDRATRRELSRLSFPEAGPQGITITPDGRFIFLSLSKQARVVVIDARARKILGYIPSGETPDGVVYTTRTFNR